MTFSRCFYFVFLFQLHHVRMKDRSVNVYWFENFVQPVEPCMHVTQNQVRNQICGCPSLRDSYSQKLFVPGYQWRPKSPEACKFWFSDQTFTSFRAWVCCRNIAPITKKPDVKKRPRSWLLGYQELLKYQDELSKINGGDVKPKIESVEEVLIKILTQRDVF